MTPTVIQYVAGDLFDFIKAEEGKLKVIPHIVNDVYKMASGFVVPLVERWPDVKRQYIKERPLLGETQFVDVEHHADSRPAIVVANMVAQHKTITLCEAKPIRYEALVRCMASVKACCKYGDRNAEIHAPRFGSDRARGTWAFIEELIQEIWCSQGIPVTIYTPQQ